MIFGDSLPRVPLDTAAEAEKLSATSPRPPFINGGEGDSPAGMPVCRAAS